MTTPPPYGSTPGQPPGYSGGSSPAGSTGGSSAGWTPPPGGDQQGYGQPQYGQPQYSQPQYGQQPGYPPPGYPAAPGYPPVGYPGRPGGTGRPGMVTAAAVLAFVWAAFAIITGLVIVAASSIVSSATDYCNSVSDSTAVDGCATVIGYSSFFKVLTVGLMIVAILLIWGGVVALTGKNGQILVIGAAVYLLLDVISIFVSISNHNFGSNGVLGVVAPVLMVVFMLNPRSKAWFKAKGAKTF